MRLTRSTLTALVLTLGLALAGLPALGAPPTVDAGRTALSQGTGCCKQ